MNGYVKLHRKILETSFYKDTPACALAFYLILRANWKDTKILWNKEEKTLVRGQMLAGRNELSEKTGMSVSQIRRALKVLVNVGFISIETTNRFSLITLCNWGLYQDEDESKQPTEDQQKTNKEPQIKNSKKNKNIYSANFEEVLMLYPNRKGKKAAQVHFNATVKSDEDLKNIKLAIENYKNSREFKGGYVMNGSTFFNNWQDYVPDKKVIAKKITKEEEDIPSPFEDMLKEKDNGIQAKTKKKEGWAVDLV